MARPPKVGRGNWAKHPKVGDCVIQDGSCFRHERARAIGKPRSQSLIERDPAIAHELDATLSGFNAQEVSCGASTVLGVWRCGSGHTYCATPNARTNARGGTGCGFCASKKATPTHNLAVIAPELVDEWDLSANGDLGPELVLPQSNQKHWWRCPVARDHLWQASPNNRFGKGSGCPMCRGDEPSSTNNLTLHAALMTEWAWDLNPGVDPTRVTRRSSARTFWWRCSNHPESHKPWQATPDKRVGGSGCGACAGHVVTATNSIASLRPDLADELDTTQPPYKTADEISIGMNDTVGWRCPEWPEAHRWRATPNNRTSGDTGCPHCNLPGSSKQEIRIAYELAHILGFDPTIHQVGVASGAKIRRVSVDMVAPALRLVVEFDGSYWHALPGAAARDAAKTASLAAEDWTVVRIREAPLPKVQDHDVQVRLLAPTHDTVVRVLRRLQQLGKVPTSAVDAYATTGRPQAAAAASRAIAERLRRGSRRSRP